MNDPTFRKYVPILAYQPKQVKLVLDLLLDVFFFKESTTSFTQSKGFEPYDLNDGWELTYTIDRDIREDIIFNTSDFVDINNATAEEVAGVINRNAQRSFAVVFDDRIQKRKFVRIFTNTIGSKGSVQITGGRANMELQFVGFNDNAGSGVSTEWTITKIGATMTFTHTGGTSPQLDKVQAGDIVIIDIPGNEGSFTVNNVNISNASFSFENLFGTIGVHDHSSFPATKVSFITPLQQVIYTRDNRSVVWEVSPGEIIVEMPASPPVVKRNLAGSAHINGFVSSIVDRVSNTEIELDDATDWPLNGGQFVLQPRNELKAHILTDTENFIDVQYRDTRFDKSNTFSYTSKVGNNLTGVIPDIPEESAVFEKTIATAVRDSNAVVTVTTTTPHDFVVGDNIAVQNTVSALTTTGIRVDVSTTDTATQVAIKGAAAINSISDFSATAVVGKIVVTNTAVGITTDSADVDSGLAIVVTQQGTAGLPEITEITQAAGSTFDVVGAGLRWEISSATDATRYHIWYNLIDGVNTQENAGQDDSVNGSFIINSVPSTTEFTYISAGEAGNSTGGLTRVERFGLAEDGSLVYLTSAQLGTGIIGPNIWDPDASFVLSSLTSNITEEIRAGTNVRTIGITPVNNIPNEGGSVIFGFGTENEEGPVRYLFKPSSSLMQLDPAYVFKNNHPVGEQITVIRRKGSHVISTTGKEYAPYITDPAIARITLQELMRATKSVGIFINFLVRYPQQLYATLDIYRSCDSNLYPINEEEAAKC